MESITESSKPPSHVSNPRKPSLSPSFSFPIRAPLTLDDDSSDFEPNDNEFGNTSSSEDSGNESETTSERPGRPFVAHSYDNKSLESGSEGETENQNPKWVRPIAKLSWDDDDDGSDLVGSEVEYGDSLFESIGVVEKIGIAPRIKVLGAEEEEEEEEEKGVDENGFMGFEEGDKFEDFNVVVVNEDSNGSELLKEEKGVEDCCPKEDCYAVEEEPVVCQSRNDNSLSLDIDVMLEREMNTDIGLDRAEDKSVDDVVEFVGDEHDFRRFEMSKQAEEPAETGKCDFSEVIEVDGYENALYSDSSLDHSVKLGADFEEGCDEEEEIEGGKRSSVSDAEDLISGSSEVTKPIMNEIDTDGDGEGQDSYDSATLMAILDAATSANGSGVLTVDDSSQKLAPQQTLTPLELRVEDEPEDNLSADEKKKIKKMQLLRVNFLRLVHRLGISLEDSVVNKVLDGLVLAFGEHNGYFVALESAKRMALDLEAEKESDLDFCLNILVLGKSGVGKSATINFIFGEKKAAIHAFEPATNSLKEIVGTIEGVKIKILDTPGLKIPAIEQAANQKILAAISKFMKKSPPDVVLYVDRLDTETGDNDLPMLKSITKSLGSEIWQKTIVTLTHSASSPPDGPLGLPLSHDIFVARKSRAVLQSISRAAGNKHLLNPSFMCPVALVENSPLFSQDSLMRSQLLLLCYSRKVLSEASSLSPLEISSDWRKFIGLPVSYLLPSHPHPNHGDTFDSYIEFGDLCDSESENEDEDEYDKLPPFRPLLKSQVAKLNKEQRKAYFEEYDYRVKLFERKQRKEALKRLREIKNKGKDGANVGHDIGDDGEEGDENFNPAAESLPLSFDGDDHAYRYRSLVPGSKLLVGPVVQTHGWDHDCGWDGVSMERDFAVAGRLPAAFHVQITKDKNELNVHLDSSISLKHGEKGSTLARLYVETFGTQLGYILRGETKVRSFLDENVAAGLKIEDQIAVGKRLLLAAGAGAVQYNGEAACGANFEVRLKDEDFPVRQDEQSSLGLCLMKWRGCKALTAVVESRFAIGGSSKMVVSFGLNNERRGRISIKTSSSDQLQITLAGILPVLVSIIGSICCGFGAQN
ncbi:Translocase of chloroplast 159 [Morus notabilis]|uniref:Translocase of chloroplast 159 n=1 Tax=Morus notabilis TaxID=981085 RepID=W9REY6_9ROSA|nr:translocase of chloroplast 159, chloroplastic [Morus notabilis]EXB74781.1 Translocase of chloroplast 159 [Morus notabilis]